MDTFEVLIACGLLCGAYVLYAGIKSPLRPFLIPLEGWCIALASVRTKLRTAGLAALVIALSDGLQEFFTYGPQFDNTVLTLASVGWQVVVAILLAMIAVPLHLDIISREPRGFFVDKAVKAPFSFTKLLLHAALIGAAVWLVSYLLNICSKLVVTSFPENAALLAYRGVGLAAFIVAAALALIRPCLSSGLSNPIRSGLRIAIANLPSLFLVESLLLIPPLVFGAVAIELVRQILGLSIGTHVLNDVSIIVFSTLQFMAVEASTVIFLRSAIRKPNPASDHARHPRVAYDYARPH